LIQLINDPNRLVLYKAVVDSAYQRQNRLILFKTVVDNAHQRPESLGFIQNGR
jgi:hypothetical protein